MTKDLNIAQARIFAATLRALIDDYVAQLNELNELAQTARRNGYHTAEKRWHHQIRDVRLNLDEAHTTLNGLLAEYPRIARSSVNARQS